MIVDFDKALETFNKIDIQYKSFYYHPLFLEASSKELSGLSPLYFVKEENNQIFYHAALIGKVGFEEYQDLQTPYGYGGPIILGDEKFKEDVTAEYIALCNELKILVEFIRFHPLIKNDQNYYGELLKNRSTVAINLDIDDLFSSFSTRVKTAIRAAEKNLIRVISSKEEEYIGAFYKTYTSLMNEKRTSKEYFFSEEYIRGLLNHKDVYLFTALTEDDEILGASIFMVCGNLADYHLSATTPKGRTLNVSHLLIYTFAEFAKQQDIQKLYLGGGSDSHPSNSLLFFKKGFSKELVTFSIGYKIFNQLKYDEYKKVFLNGTDNRDRRVLFYR